MEAKNIYTSIGSLSELTDGQKPRENTYIELKAVHENLNTAKPVQIGDFKLRIAKEMCAFANTDGGVIAIGIDEDTGKIINKTENLEKWLDNNIRHMLEPQLLGLAVKTCVDESGNEFVVMYVPKGKSIPYRVSAPKAYEKKKESAREYYQRIGTHSEKIEMPIVRSLYLSNDRTTRISAASKLIRLDRRKVNKKSKLTLAVEVTPDPTKLVSEYYLESDVMFLDRGFNDILDETESISWWTNRQPVIPPDDTPYIYNERDFTAEKQQQSPANSLLPASVLQYTKVPIIGGDVEVDEWVMESVYAIYIKTSFACEGVPKITDNRIIIIGDHEQLDENSWNEPSNWINENCVVVRFKSLGPNESDVVSVLENYIETKGLS